MTESVDKQAAIAAHINAAYPNREFEPAERRDWHLARAIMSAYIERYPADSVADGGEWDIVGVEYEFQVPIYNPETGARSRSFWLRGKIDMVVRVVGKLWVVEHKTAGNIDMQYIERLPEDDQIMTYNYAAGHVFEEPIEGVIYNVVAKKKLKQGEGESEGDFVDGYERNLAKYREKLKQKDDEPYDEFRIRSKEKFDALKSCPTRNEPEPDDVFAARLAAYYTGDAGADMFHREQLYFSADDLTENLGELWTTTQFILNARRFNMWPKNRGSGTYNSPCNFCSYRPLCVASVKGRENLINDMYVVNDRRHAELDQAPVDWAVAAKLESLTVSAIRTFRMCPRQYYYRYERWLKLKGESAYALRLGSVFHDCLEMFYAPEGAERTG